MENLISERSHTIWGRLSFNPRWPLHFSERKLLLGFVDLVLINLALIGTLALLSNPPMEITPGILWLNISWFLVLSALWFSIAQLFDIYNLARAASPLYSFWATAGSTAVTSGVYMAIPVLTPDLPQYRLALILFPLLTIGLVGAWRLAYAFVFVQPNFQRTALVIGAGIAGQTLVETMSSASTEIGNPFHGTGYRLIGFIDDDPDKQQCRLADLPVLGTHIDLPQLVRRHNPDELILAITHPHTIQPSLFQAILECREKGIAVTDMPLLYERLTERIALDHAGQNLNVVLPLEYSPVQRFYQGLMRSVDIVASLVGCLFLGMLIPIIWVANRISAPGPLFYQQTRVGRGGIPFDMLKFRSMVVDAEKYGAVWAMENDPRITPIGRILRLTRLDEFPQFWNILKGEMSLIGPRPERPAFVEELNQHIPFYRVRHAVKPGLTGWAQVKYRYGASIQDARVKLEYDLYYIKNKGAFLDLQILLRTVQVMLGFKGR